jgi:tetratricopeptide (TPR) repeat protein
MPKKIKKVKKPHTPIKTWKDPSILLLFLAVILILIVFSPVLKNDFISLDDDVFIYNNSMIQSLGQGHLKDIFSWRIFNPFYKPLVFLSWALEYRLSGNNPFWFHFDNLLLHLLNALLLFYLLRNLLNQLKKGDPYHPWLAFFITLLWALHPLKVESVAWATERKDVLYGFFFFSSLLCYIKYIEKDKTLFIWAGALLFGLGLLCKSMILTLPFILFVADYLLKRKATVRLISEKIPYFIVFLAALVIYGFFGKFGHFEGRNTLAIVQSMAGEAAKDYPFLEINGFVSKIILISYRLLYWLGQILYPHKLSLIYPVPVFLSHSAYSFTVFLYPVAVILLSLAALYSARFTRVVVAGFLFALLSLITVLGMPGHETSMLNDRYTYLASLGVIAVFVTGAYSLAMSFRRLKYGLLAVMAIIVLWGAAVTYRQCGVWKNSYVLWSDVASKYPRMAYAHFYLGNIKFRSKQYNEAIRDYNLAIEQDSSRAEFYRNRGSARDNLGDFQGAFNDFSRAIELYPSYAAAYYDRGGTRFKLKERDYRGAIADITEAIRIEPTYAEAYYRRGFMLRITGDHAKAIDDFDRYLQANPNNDRAYLYRGLSEWELQRHDEACRDWQRASQLGNAQARSLVKQRCK